MRRQIGGALAVRGTSFDLAETTAAGDAERLAKEAVRLGYRSGVAAGGDGTIAEVITGLAGGPVPLGIIPLGTGNQLASNLGIPPDVERAVDVAVNGVSQTIDLGQLGNGRYFALMAGAGWDAEVMGSCSRELKERWGFGAYLFQGLRRVAAPPSPAVSTQRPAMSVLHYLGHNAKSAGPAAQDRAGRVGRPGRLRASRERAGR